MSSLRRRLFPKIYARLSPAESFRFNIFFVTSGLAIFTPILLESILYFATGVVRPSLLGSLALTALSTTNYIWMLRSKRLYPFFVANAAIVSLGVSAIVLASGGFHALSFPFFALITINAGFLLGRKGALWSAAYLICFFAFLTYCEGAGVFLRPSVAAPLGARALIASFAALAAAGAIYFYEYERNAIEASLEKEKQAHAANERRLEEAQAIARIGSWSYDLATGKMDSTKQLHEIFGDSGAGERENADGQRALERHFSTIHPEDLEKWTTALETSLLNGRSFKITLRNLIAGKTLWVEAHIEPARDLAGQISGLRGTCRDVTEAKIAAEENQFVLDALQIGVWKYNPEKKSLHWDKSMYQVLELDEAQFSSPEQALAYALAPEAPKMAIEKMRQALAGNGDFSATFSVPTRSRGARIFAARGKALRCADGRPTMLYGIVFDRTAETELERRFEAERAVATHNAKLASLGEVAAGVAHEVNNPLAIISAAIGTLPKWRENEEKFNAKLDVLQRSVQRIARIVNSLRKYSRTADKARLEPRSLAEIVEESLVLTDSRAKRYDATVRLDLQVPGKILCDETEIEQVLINLIHNGLDATQGAKERWVELCLLEEGPEVVLRIRDSGSGISPEAELKIFQPFFTTKPVGEGTGLGLSVAKGILDQHGAKIRLDRSDAHTCFEIRFQKFVEIQAAAGRNGASGERKSA
jgi:signal transduction histidine kinase